MWQDWIFALGSVVFMVALIPALRATEKPPVSTSLMTAMVLEIFATTQATLHLYVASIASVILAFEWATLAWQGLRQKHGG